MVDFSKLTDDELLSLASGKNKTVVPEDIPSLPEDTLAALAAGKGKRSPAGASIHATDDAKARAPWRPQTESIGRAALGGLNYGAVETLAPSGAIDLAGRYIVAPAMYGMDKAMTGVANAITGGDTKPRSLDEYRRIAGVTEPLSKHVQDYLPMDQGKEGTWARPVSDITELIPQAVAMKGNPIKNGIAYGVLPGATGFVAEQAAKDTRFEPYAKTATQILTALGSGMLVDPTRAQKSVVSASKFADPQQLADAMGLINAAKDRGINLTVDEALSYVTNGGTSRLGNMRRIAENSGGGRDVLSSFTANRPNETRAAAEAMLDRIGPAPANPSFVPSRVNDAANTAIDRVRQGINSAAEPFYNAAENVSLPAQEFARLKQDPAFAQALKELRSDPVLNKRVAHLPDDSIGVLNAVKIQLDTGIDQAKSALTPNNNRAGILTGTKQELVKTADNASPDYAKARGIVEEKTGRILDPLRAGPLGDLSRATDVSGIRSAIIPQGKNVLERQHEELKRGLGLLSSFDEQAARDAVRVAAGAEKNAAFTPRTATVEGADLYGGSRFANAVGAQGQQRKNFLSTVEAVSGRPAANEANTTLDALAATGHRPATGSRTAFNAQDMADLRGTSIASLDATKPLAMIGNMIEQARMTGKTKEIADFLTGGSVSIEQLMALRQKYPDLVSGRMIDQVLGRGGRAIGHTSRAAVPGLLTSDQ